MPKQPRADLEQVRALYARMMAAASGTTDPRYERIFANVPREAFLPPGPWHLSTGAGYVETPTADPAHLYQNVLVALDATRGINNGEPFLHAQWLGRVAPAPGETVTLIGAGTGYYAALLALLVLPGGGVTAYEIEPALAKQAAANLRPFDTVRVVAGDATAAPLPPSDIIYVAAGVVAPPLSWLAALKPGGRLILPWQPTSNFGLTLVIRPAAAGFAVTPGLPVGFIPCIGASDAGSARLTPTYAEARTVRALHRLADRAPDASAVAIYPDIWFSSAPPEAN